MTSPPLGPILAFMLKGIVRLAIFGFVATMIAGMVGAVLARRRATPPPDPAADEISIVVAFDQLLFRSQAQAFRGGRIEAWYAGGTVDLREARLAPAGAHLELLAVFGGGQLVIPDSWQVSISPRAFAGGIADTRPAVDRPSDAPLLTIDAMLIFGGFQVTSELPEAVARQFIEAASA
jgi:hypothetical protein